MQDLLSIWFPSCPPTVVRVEWGTKSPRNQLVYLANTDVLGTEIGWNGIQIESDEIYRQICLYIWAMFHITQFPYL